MIKLIVSLLLSVSVCCAADESHSPDEQQEFMHTFLSKSQQERQAIIQWLHQALSVDKFQINDEQEIIYNGKIPEDLTLLGDVIYAILAKQVSFDEALNMQAHGLNEHTRLLRECSANLAKFAQNMTFFEDRTTQVIARMGGRLSHVEAGISGLEEKVDRLKQLFSVEELTNKQSTS